MKAIIFPVVVLAIAGDNLNSIYIPAFTMVALWRSADEGVGATMAPISHVEKGICAAFVSAANAIRATGMTE